MNGKVPEHELARLRSDPGCLRLYSSKVALTRRGKKLEGLCPFHHDTTPSFYIDQKNGEYMWTCWSCPGGKIEGNIFQFLEKLDGIKFPKAVEVVQEFLHGSRPKSSWEQTKTEVDSVFQPLAGKKEYKTYPLAKLKPAEDALVKSDEARAWLAGRGIRLETAQSMHVGFKQTLDMAKYKDADIAGSGWLVFPCIEGDTVVGIKYRSIVKKTFYRQTGMRTALFGTQEIDVFEPVYVTEGECDQLVMKQAGYRAVSLPSAITSLGPEMKDQLMQASRVVLAGDCDGGAGDNSMEKLWAELAERTYLLKWPGGKKDANDVWLYTADREPEKFREIVEELTFEAYASPAPFVTSLADAMTSSRQTDLKNSPLRMRFEWPTVDEMAIIMPGSVVGIMATNSGMGKTSFAHQILLYSARKHDARVLNYQCELTIDEMVTLTAAQLLKKHRNHLTAEDLKKAQDLLGDTQYYIGRNPNLATIEPILDLIESAIRRLGITIACLDNLHFACRNEDNEIQAQANAMQRIKRMAQKYGTIFVVIGQPRKAKQETKGKEIHVTDWKGSAAGVDDADVLFIMHREWLKNVDPLHPPMDQYSPVTTIKRAKARAAGDGAAVAQLMFMGTVASFETLTPEPEFIPEGQTTLGGE